MYINNETASIYILLAGNDWIRAEHGEAAGAPPAFTRLLLAPRVVAQTHRRGGSTGVVPCHGEGHQPSPALLWDSGVLAAHPALQREQGRSGLGHSAAPPPSSSPASPTILPEVHRERGGKPYWLGVHWRLLAMSPQVFTSLALPLEKRCGGETPSLVRAAGLMDGAVVRPRCSADTRPGSRSLLVREKLSTGKVLKKPHQSSI